MRHTEHVFERLLAEYGPQGWWPAREPFEIVAGAVLVQRTAWPNAAAAVRNLARAGLLDPARLVDTAPARLEVLIRPAGFFRVKAARLRAVAVGIVAGGGIDRLATLDTETLRAWLLGLDGVGAETADSILLYAFERPAVVVDAYLRRFARRLDGSLPATGAALDLRIRQSVAAALRSTQALNEFHALIVEHGKRICGQRPQCRDCIVREICDTGRVTRALSQSDDQPNPSPRR